MEKTSLNALLHDTNYFKLIIFAIIWKLVISLLQKCNIDMDFYKNLI